MQGASPAQLRARPMESRRKTTLLANLRTMLSGGGSLTVIRLRPGFSKTSPARGNGKSSLQFAGSHCTEYGGTRFKVERAKLG